MTPREYWTARNKAALKSEEHLKGFDRQVVAITNEGIANGGLTCCGTRGAWHRPWCYMGPTEPEKEVRPMGSRISTLSI